MKRTFRLELAENIELPGPNAGNTDKVLTTHLTIQEARKLLESGISWLPNGTELHLYDGDRLHSTHINNYVEPDADPFAGIGRYPTEDVKPYAYYTHGRRMKPEEDDE